MTTVTILCGADGCDRDSWARGWCLKHYKRWRNRGTVHDITTEERFFSHVEQDGDCWLWIAFRQPVGDYGKFWYDGRCLLAHRWSYEFLRGEIPDGLALDHLCSNPPCVNPWHLEPVTQRENLHRSQNHVGVNARKTHCLCGHEFTSENTYIDKRGRRGCRRCMGIRANRAKAGDPA